MDCVNKSIPIISRTVYTKLFQFSDLTFKKYISIFFKIENIVLRIKNFVLTPSPSECFRESQSFPP